MLAGMLWPRGAIKILMDPAPRENPEAGWLALAMTVVFIKILIDLAPQDLRRLAVSMQNVWRKEDPETIDGQKSGTPKSPIIPTFPPLPLIQSWLPS